MPRQIQVRKIPTDEIQGEGSYVEVISPKVGEIRSIQEAPPGQDYLEIIAMLKRCVVSWNWEDEEGNPLSLPKDDPAAVDDLTNDEALYLLRQLASVGHLVKN